MNNSEHLPRDVVTIGASAGGVQALIYLIGRLPADFRAAVGIVLHRSPFYGNRLPTVLGCDAAVDVVESSNGQPIAPGMVYVAPRDQHMVMNDGTLRLHRGPREHHVRPAIDPLFRSAAATYGPRVVGVLLSGMGADGVSGLMSIKARGGLSLVQDPTEAAFPTMPNNAICSDVDGILRLEDIAATLVAAALGRSIGSGRTQPATR